MTQNEKAAQKKNAVNAVKWIVLLILFLFFIAPFVLVLINVFKDMSDITKNPLSLIGTDHGFTLANFPNAMQKMDFWRVFLNSFIITVCATILTILFSAMASFVIVRNNKWIACVLFFSLMVASMVIPFQVLMVPLVSVYGGMQNWDSVAIREPEAPWAGQMTVPRELFIRDGRLYQKPIRELERLRREKVMHEGVRVCGNGGLSLAGVAGRVLDLELAVRPVPDGEPYTKFEIRFAKNDRFFTRLSFRPHEKMVKLDREFSGSRRAIVHQRRCLADGYDGVLRLRIVLDIYSVEVFIDDGRQTMTAAIYTDPSAEEITFHADGEAVVDVVKYGVG